MIICHCMRVTDREIRQAARTGAGTRTEVSDRCGAAACCGGCAPAVDEILAEENPAARVTLVPLRKSA